ncbi:MAG: VCBS repeat-containing protein [Gemmatirosa sp.]
MTLIHASRPRRHAAVALLARWTLAAGALGGCSGALDTADEGLPRGEAPPVNGQLFTRLPSSYTGVRFENRLEDTPELNVFTYRNFYNGGGVAIGDLTGDSLPELILTSNRDGASLYLNQGRLQFRNVTERAGLQGRGGWTTGVALADVDGDGRLDVYLSHAGPEAEGRANELWLNQGLDASGVPTFVERAAAFGIADRGYSTHAAFLDYDRDGDLDLFVINNSPRPVSSFGMRNTRHVRDSLGGHRLYRNDPSPDGSGRKFADVSARAGIHGSEIGFGLGLGVSDVNRDGWPDLYVANDFFEHDYLYVNRGDGTFDEQLDRQMPVTSYFSMGMDVADVDDDGWPDVYTTDMLPEDEYRFKTTASFEGWDVYQTKLRNGYGHQAMRNMLQRNNGDGTFSDVGQMARVDKTDWSWSALIADLDLDGRKDVYVTNGLLRDVTSQDYIAFLANDATRERSMRGGKVDYMQLISAMASTPLPDYAFRNEGDLRFTNQAKAWGLDAPSFSNGAAYGDLDADGALDLVVNNVNAEAFVYRNNARSLHPDRHFLQVRLEGTGANRLAFGARVTVHGGERQLVLEQAPSRGFQSSVDPVPSFGLGTLSAVDSVTVEWPDGRTTVQRRVAADRRITLRQADASPAAAPTPPRPAPPAWMPAGLLVADVTTRTPFDFVHRENDFVDFDRERLLPKLLSTEGPYLAVGDVNGDGLDDAYLSGAKEQPGHLLLQGRDGSFRRSNAGVFEPDAVAEDLGAAFFDADGDADLDLYVVSGGSEFSDLAPALQDRLYVNDGRGSFRRTTGQLPTDYVSGSRVVPADYDRDGDVDLFVGGRAVPWKYGADPQSTLLQNDGRGRFTDVTAQLAPALARVGLVTDATWRDVDGDARPDLVVVGEWMPITVFRNAGGGKLAPMPVPGLERSHGWWNRVVAGDFTGDGRVDFVVGNLGLNTRLRASATEPTTMYVKDFDGNGFVEQVLATYNEGKAYPFALRDDLIKAIPPLKARFLNYKDYARRTVSEIFPEQELADAVVKTAHTFESTLARNNGDGSFTLVPLPREAQLAPVYGILADDVDADGRTDLLLAGNFDGVEPEIGRMSASYGLLLRGDGKGGFAPVRAKASGFRVPGQARDIQRLRTSDGDVYVVTRNNDRPLVFRPVSRD